MTIIRVEPESVRGYGREAQEKFNEVRAALESLVRDVVEVRYFGPNAVDFKQKIGSIAADFANKLSQDLGTIAAEVSRCTSNIAASLGGEPITIAVDGTAITPPSPEQSSFVDLDTSALDALASTVSTYLDSVSERLSSHLSALQATDWLGNAKNQAVDQVTAFTSAAQTRVTDARTSITTFISEQVKSAVEADK